MHNQFRSGTRRDSERVSSSLDASIAELRLALEGRPTVTTLCHENPDGDTIGAAVAMALAAEQLGCRAELVSADHIPPAYEHLLGELPVSSVPTLEPGLAVVCDAATLTRIGRVAVDCQSWLSASTIVNIDHHITNDRFGAINVVDPAAAASCEVVSYILDQTDVSVDSRMAAAILTGIVRDSHGFSSSATRSATFRAAARAVDAGAEVEPIYRATLLEMEPAAVDLWGRLLSRLERTADGRLVHTMLLPDDLDATGADQHDAEGLVEFLMRERGVEIGILFRQLDDGIRVSIRTSASIDAARIAASFNGGGHARRAGCVIPVEGGRGPGDVLAVCRAVLGWRLATIGHLAAGLALARASGDRWPVIPTLAVVAAAAAPDIDLLLGLNHRGPTHSIGFAASLGVAYFAVGRAVGFRLAGRIGLLAALAVLSHVALDLATAHSPVAAFWPFSRREFALPFLLLPSAPTDEELVSARGAMLLLAEVAWSAATILVGILVGRRRTASPVT